TAEVTGNLTIIGGTGTRAAGARVSGEVRIYHDPLDYRTNGEEIALAPESARHRLPFFGARKSWSGSEAHSVLTIATAGTFNRVEGLPIVAGPRFDWNGLTFEALGIARSVGDVGGEPGNLGYLVRSEMRSTANRSLHGLGIGVRAFSTV